MATEPKLAILGLGSVLRADDGIGVHLVTELTRTAAPSDAFELIDAGVGGLRLLNWFDRFEAILAVDAAEMNLSPGSHRWITPAQIAGDPDMPFTLHDLDFSQTLWYTEKFFARPATVIFAIQPQTVALAPALSPALAHALPHLVNHLREALENWTANRLEFLRRLRENPADQRDKLLLDGLCQRSQRSCTNIN